jgi:hypothetical protein
VYRGGSEDGRGRGEGRGAEGVRMGEEEGRGGAQVRRDRGLVSAND